MYYKVNIELIQKRVLESNIFYSATSIPMTHKMFDVTYRGFLGLNNLTMIRSVPNLRSFLRVKFLLFITKI